MDRRTFLAKASAVVALAYAPVPVMPADPVFPNADPRWKRTWDAALKVLADNIKVVPGYDQPVLLEGAVYPGVWQECAPQEGLVYGSLARYITPVEDLPTPLQIARNNHLAFFSLQKPDGQLPCSVKMSATGFGQIQMVVPIAATAWELVQMTHDERFLHTAYEACSRWDAWLRRFRDTRKTGLTEGFCVYDTGHDNSPRWTGSPKQCPQADARLYDHTVATLPRLCPDLSATTYGGRVALAAMATALGKKEEAARWQADAEIIRHLIIERLYDPKDAAFYDLDAQGNFVRVRSDVISRVLGEHVLKLSDRRDRAIFEAVWTRQIRNPNAFWALFPLTSIAQDDPAFVRPIPRNSWGGASQALTALRAPRWMSYYSKDTELRHLMYQWCEAISRYTEFRQQMDPLTGDFTRVDASGYSPAALTYLDFIVRLQGSGKAGRM
ncbi:alpha-L-rhamnosidase [Granulicella sp. dw_53]|uniref:MGH1-like glycoside hydrolase domain-containing protein n=1 Tax=Granulicella sp. dw_53 TaxID=2719792 RepID=UPI001BD1F719|nr:alpha-L-rhamnosidase [Granulicella sp. dw_53]